MNLIEFFPQVIDKENLNDLKNTITQKRAALNEINILK